MNNENSKDLSNKKSFVYSFKFWFFLSILFWIIYSTIFYIFKDSVLLIIPDDINREILGYFLKYWVFLWIVFFLISFIKISFFWFISFIFKLNKYKITKPFIYALNFKTCAIFGFRLIYFEPRNTSIAIAIIEFFGKPLFYSSLFLLVPVLIWFFMSFIKLFFKKNDK